MRKLPVIATLAFLFAAIPLFAQEPPAQDIVVESLNQIFPNAPVGSTFSPDDGRTIIVTNGAFVRSGDTTLTADSVSVNTKTHEAAADGHVRIEREGEIWVGDHIDYNFTTRQLRSEEFRTGKPPVFAAGNGLQGDLTNKTYGVNGIFVTTDDISDPAIRVRASRVLIVPGQYVEMWNAVLYVDGVPAFYFPYYHRNLGERANNWNFLAGGSSTYGPFLLNTYTWYLNDAVDGRIHLDYREKRGFGIGPDLNLHLGQWGEASFRYYYLHDLDPTEDTNGPPLFAPLSHNRQRVYFSYEAMPVTNLAVKALVNYQTDPLVLHDFFEGEYANNPQPQTFVEVNPHWDNWSLDALTTPELNNFFDQVERLPDVKLTGFRQQVFNTPIYYDSESSAGYYRQFFADTNFPGPNLNGDYAAARADTYQELLLPHTFFGWLNVTPHVGGRFTYYGTASGPGGVTSSTSREIFDTGVDVSFKASRLWTDATNSFLDLDGLRHIIEPSLSYVYVPTPNKRPWQLPQFDSALPSLELLPVAFPDYNNVDSIDRENLIRFGLRNTLQTMRDGQLDNLLDWNLALDWRLNGQATNNLDEPFSTQPTFSDLYSDLTFKPRSWITLESQLRYDINDGNLNLAFHQLTFTPNETWSWGLGHWYLRGGFDGFSQADDFITSTIFYRFDDNWGLRATHFFNAEDGRLQEQFYSIYRDMRSWTAALTFRVTDNSTGPEDFTVAFSFSLKASPRYRLGEDAVSPYHLVGE